MQDRGKVHADGHSGMDEKAIHDGSGTHGQRAKNDAGNDGCKYFEQRFVIVNHGVGNGHGKNCR